MQLHKTKSIRCLYAVTISSKVSLLISFTYHTPTITCRRACKAGCQIRRWLILHEVTVRDMDQYGRHQARRRHVNTCIHDDSNETEECCCIQIYCMVLYIYIYLVLIIKVMQIYLIAANIGNKECFCPANSMFNG